jgi:hypothetical protein
MFRIAAKYNAPVHVHLRFMGSKEPDSGLAGLEEVIAAAATTGAPLHVVHVTSMALRDTPQLIAMIEAAQRRGFDITTECYPYSAFKYEPRDRDLRPGMAGTTWHYISRFAVGKDRRKTDTRHLRQVSKRARTSCCLCDSRTRGPCRCSEPNCHDRQ